MDHGGALMVTGKLYLNRHGPVSVFGAAACTLALGTVVLVAACRGDDRHPTTRAETAQATQTPPARIAVSSMPECHSDKTVACFRDTAYSHDEPSLGTPVLRTVWIWFGSAGDSLEFFANVDTLQERGRAYVTTNLGQERDSDNVTASFVRLRLKSDGVVEVFVDIDENLGDTVPYSLAVRRVESGPTALNSTGRFARLNIVSAHIPGSLTVVPARLGGATADRSRWRVYARPYNVALLTDTLYEICRSPCLSRDTIVLKPAAHVIGKY
jgi:hypothetical protein